MPTIAAMQTSAPFARASAFGAAARHRRQVYAVCALICLRGALAFRRSAAALARANASAVGSAPVPAFPETDLTSVTRFDLSRVYRAPRRPVVMPVERWPRAARERMANPPASTAPAPLFRHAFRKGALHERGDGICNRYEDGSQEIVALNVTYSAGRIWIAKSAYTSRTGGLLGSTSFSSIGASPKMPMTAGSLPPFFTPS